VAGGTTSRWSATADHGRRRAHRATFPRRVWAARPPRVDRPAAPCSPSSSCFHRRPIPLHAGCDWGLANFSVPGEQLYDAPLNCPTHRVRAASHLMITSWRPTQVWHSNVGREQADFATVFDGRTRHNPNACGSAAGGVRRFQKRGLVARTLPECPRETKARASGVRSWRAKLAAARAAFPPASYFARSVLVARFTTTVASRPSRPCGRPITTAESPGGACPGRA